MSTEQIIVNDVAIQTSVAPIEVPSVEVAVKQTKEKKPKKVSDSPKLAPRFQKFIDFGYWVALQLKNKNLINDEVFQTILTDIKMNDEVGVQTEFYTNYEKSGKSGKPTGRDSTPDAPSLPADGLEAKPKAKKSRKPTGRDSTPDAPSLPVEGSEVVPVEGVPVEEKPKAKKSRKPTGRDSTPDAPSLPVEGSEVVPVEGVPVEEKPKAKKTRKPKASSDASSDATQTVPVEGSENKSTKKSRKSKAPDDIIHSLLADAISSE